MKKISIKKLRKESPLANIFGELCEELFVKYPMLMSDPGFRKKEIAIYKEIEKYEAMLNVAGVA